MGPNVASIRKGVFYHFRVNGLEWGKSVWVTLSS